MGAIATEMALRTIPGAAASVARDRVSLASQTNVQGRAIMDESAARDEPPIRLLSARVGGDRPIRCGTEYDNARLRHRTVRAPAA
jgi:hypothetical protein